VRSGPRCASTITLPSLDLAPRNQSPASRLDWNPIDRFGVVQYFSKQNEIDWMLMVEKSHLLRRIYLDSRAFAQSRRIFNGSKISQSTKRRRHCAAVIGSKRGLYRSIGLPLNDYLEKWYNRNRKITRVVLPITDCLTSIRDNKPTTYCVRI